MSILGHLLATCSAVMAASSIDIPVGERQLFLDDYCIAKQQHLTTTMHQPEKKGAVVRPDGPGEIALQIRCAPVWNDKQRLYKLWLLPRLAPGPSGEEMHVRAYACSKDGIHWTKPGLGLTEYRGSKQNNLLGSPGPENVVEDLDDPDPNRRYKSLLHAGDCRNPIVSADGIHWSHAPGQPLPSLDESNLSYDRQTRAFIATLKTGGPHGRSHAIWTSNNFRTWTNTNAVFSADDLDQKLGRPNIECCFADPSRKHPEYNIPETYNVDVYNLAVFRYEGLYVGMPAMFHQTGKVSKDWTGFDKMPLTEEIKQDVRRYGDWSGFHHVQLACSRDLRHWKRLGQRRPFLDLSPVAGEAYDTQVILPPSDAVVRGDELWFYYTGMRSYATVSGTLPDQGAVCLAVLRRDGFVSLDAGDTLGTLLTKPFNVNGTKLLVNVNAAGGSLDIEVLDDNEKSLALSQSVTGDRLRASVSWKSGDLARLQGRAIRLRFLLRNARLYSFWLDN
jgi:hypothetical protein